MPWKNLSLIGERSAFVLAALKRTQPFIRLCRAFRISGKTGYKWLARFREDGRHGLANCSRRPHRSPQRCSPRWVQAIRRLRQQHPSWGAKKIRAQLRWQHPRIHLPVERTITRWLQRLDLVRVRLHRTKRGPCLSRPPFAVAQRSNDVWTVDFKGWFRTTDGTRVEPLTARDLHSRFVLGIQLLRNQEDGPVRAAMTQWFRQYGLPRVIHVDNGAPFGGKGALGLSRLSVWWLRLGIRVEFSRRAHPEDNAAHEQMHRIFKTDTSLVPKTTIRLQQAYTNRWIRYYNEIRPHEALGQQPPSHGYRPSPRRLPKRWSDSFYPKNWPVRRVRNRGHLRWQGRLRFVGRAFVGELLGLRPIRPGVKQIYLQNQLIGELHATDIAGMRPAKWVHHKIDLKK